MILTEKSIKYVHSLLIREGDNNYKRTKKRIRELLNQYGISCGENDEVTQELFKIINDTFGASDTKSTSYKLLPGLARMIIQNGLVYKGKRNPQISLGKDGVPKLKNDVLYALSRIIDVLEKENIFDYDSNFRMNGSEISFDELKNRHPFSDEKEFLESLIKRYSIYKTSTGYNIINIPNFKVAKLFSVYNPALCYLHRTEKFQHYASYQLLLCVKDNMQNINHVEYDKTKDNINKVNSVISKNDEYALSSIGIAIDNYGVVTVTCRYSWQVGATNFDYDFDELNKILGVDIKNLIKQDNLNIVNNLILNSSENEKEINKMKKMSSIVENVIKEFILN